MLNFVNAERAKYGSSPLMWSSQLATLAEQRAAEISICLDKGHYRPDGIETGGMLYARSCNIFATVDGLAGENLAWASSNESASFAMKDLMHSDGHRANILNPKFRYFGAAKIIVQDMSHGTFTYWVQAFSSNVTQPAGGSWSGTPNSVRTVNIKKKLLNLTTDKLELTLKRSTQSEPLCFYLKNTKIPEDNAWTRIDNYNLSYSSSNTSVVQVVPNDGIVKAVGAGTATITASLKVDPTEKVAIRVTVTDPKIATTPQVAKSLVYNGKSQTGVPSNSTYTLSGTYTATNAGTYTAYATPKSGYKWSDGTTAKKTLTWTIAQKTPTLSVSLTNIWKNVGDAASKVTVAYNGDGAVSVKSSNTAAATVSYASSTKTITITPKAAGSTTITVSAAAGKNYKAASKTISVTVKQSSTSVAVPKAKTGLVYNGSTQTGVSAGTGYTITGNTGSNAGSYTATATLKSGYKWSDGTQTQKKITWTIAKATPTLSLSATSLSVKAGDPARTITYSYNGNGSVSATSSSSSVVSVSVSSGKIIITPRSQGNATITVSAPATTNYNAKTATITVTVSASNASSGNSSTIQIPIANAGLIYNGSTQTGVSAGTGYTITGNTGSNAGSYTATATLKTGYKWSDGTQTQKKITWTIAKATPTLSLSAASLSVKAGDPARTITYSYNGNGSVSATSSSSSVVSVSVSSGKIIITPRSQGNATITVSAPATTNYNAKTATIAVTVLSENENVNESRPHFIDVKDSAWYKDGIDYVVDKGIMKGYDGTNRFGVGDTLTRAQAAQVLYRYNDAAAADRDRENYPTNQTGMSDVASRQWYTGAANWAVRNNVISGFKDSHGGRTFRPNSPVTFEQFVLIITRQLTGSDMEGYDTSSLNRFSDHNLVSSWAAPAMAWAVDNGIVQGGENGKLMPRDNVSRERAATILMRALQ